MTVKKDKGAESALLIAAREKYKVFLDTNPTAGILEYPSDVGQRIALTHLWGDDSVALAIPDDDDPLAETLSTLFLPPRYTAIYHKDTKRLEVIWSAFKLPDNQEEIKGRKFSFRLKGKSYSCDFAPSSPRVMELAKHVVPLQASMTNFRNLRSYSEVVSGTERNRDAYSEPHSFWISSFNWDDEFVLNLIRHINFYLRYYDTSSPVVEIHADKISEKVNPKNRYIEGKFPAKIASRDLQASLLVFYSASFDSNNASNFLNLYRIVEFVSYGHMHESLRKQILNVLGRPSVLDQIEQSTTEILMMLRETKLEREQDTIIRLLVDVLQPSRIWNEICQNKSFFSKDTQFDGDLTIKKIISDKDSLKTFESKGVENFARSTTQIRNALAHGKDSKTAKTILPTSRNFELLKPWVHLMAIAAAEVVLYDAAH